MTGRFMYDSGDTVASGGLVKNFSIPNGAVIQGVELFITSAGGPNYVELIFEYGPLTAGVRLATGWVRNDGTTGVWPLSWTGKLTVPETSGTPCFIRYKIDNRTGTSTPYLLSVAIE